MKTRSPHKKRIALLQALQTFWKILTEPSKSITQLDKRREARLLLSFLIVIALIGIPLIILRVVTDESFMLPVVVIVGYIAFFFLIVLARTRYYKISGYVLVYLIALINLVQPFFSYNTALFPDGLAYVTVSLILSSLFTDRKNTIVLSAIIIGSIVVLPFVSTEIDLVDVQSLFAYFLIICTLLVIFLSHRENAEKDRLQQLNTSREEYLRLYQEKRVLASNLETLVVERTAELQQTNEELRNMSQLKDEFVANVSHELRTPITTIGLYLDLINRKPENLHSYVPILSREKGRLTCLIEDLLLLSRLDQNRERVSFSILNLNRVVETFAHDRNILAQARDIKLEVSLSASPPFAKADQRLIEQVLSILLTNAVNYTPRGGEVTIGTHFQNDTKGRVWSCVFVSDSGPGISEAERKHIFSRFFRGKVGVDARTNGTGLGLAIAKEILTLHEGSIALGDSSEGAILIAKFPAVELEL